jgi:cytochrome b5
MYVYQKIKKYCTRSISVYINATKQPVISHLTQSFSLPGKLVGGPKVYDVTKYLDDHPGGAEVMLDVAGQDADEFFEDIGHSKDAREELKKYLVGDYKMDEAALKKMREEAEKREAASGGGSTMIMILVAILAIAFGYYKTQMS